MNKHVAIYIRVSSDSQTHASQTPDLKRWAAAQDQRFKVYRDTATGKSMDRPAWRRLEHAMRQGHVAAVVCWRIDRLGRTAKELTALFEELQQRKVNLVSIKDGVDLGTAGGRMLATVLSGVAQFETEVRYERQLAGIAAAKAAGKKWGGSLPGVRKKVTPAMTKAIILMHTNAMSISGIAATVKLSRATVRSVLAAC